MGEINAKMELTDKQIEMFEAVESPDIDDICYGGARKGGKSRGGRMCICYRRLKLPGTIGFIMRQTVKEVETNHVEPIKSQLYQWGLVQGEDYKYNVNDSFFTFPKFKKEETPSQIFLGYGDTEEDAKRYQGLPLMDILFDEATNIKVEVMTLVSGSLANEFYPESVPKKILTCNPGGVSSDYIEENYVNAETRRPRSVFIQAFHTDNPFFMKSDPGFADRLREEYKDQPWILQQWLEGNWHASRHSYFAFDPKIGGRHVRPVTVPYYAKWYSCSDPGYEDPFAVLWAARWKDDRGRDHLHCRREIYQSYLGLDEQAERAVNAQKALREEEKINGRITAYTDCSARKKIPGEKDKISHTTLKTWKDHGWRCDPARQSARVDGWMLVRFLLKNDILTIDPACRSLRQEMKAAQFMKMANGHISEDLNQSTGDHLLDDLRMLSVETFGLSYPRIHKDKWPGVSDRKDAPIGASA